MTRALDGPGKITRTSTGWRCPICHGVGSVEHDARAAEIVVLSLAATQHIIRQPRCSSRRVVIASPTTEGHTP